MTAPFDRAVEPAPEPRPTFWPSCPSPVGGGMWIAHVIGPRDEIVDEARADSEAKCRREIAWKADRWNRGRKAG